MTFTCVHPCERCGLDTEHSVSGIKFLKHKVQFVLICLDCLEEASEGEEIIASIYEMTYNQWFEFIPNEFKASSN